MGYQATETECNSLMRRLAYIVIVIAGMLAAAPVVLAAESQFYFVGKVVTSSDPVPGARHIYLRWDPVEVQLPADIVEIRLQRNGEVVGTWPSNAVMTAAQIGALYRGGDHQRRKLETITRLNEIAGEQGQAFSPSAFADTLHQLINPALLDTYNPLWAFLGSRTDFTIARARHRAWIDTTPVTAENRSVVEYELLGANSGGATVRLGYLEIDPTTTQSVLGAQQLEQLRVSDMRLSLIHI